MKEHVLEKITVTDEPGYKSRTFTVYGGLHYIKGNAAPYFSLTYWCGGPNTGHGGAGHEEILKRFPKYADLAALHLSDMNGQPMHAEANGWYWLEGAFGGLGSQYYGDKPAEECRKIFRDHMRFTDEQLETVWLDLSTLRVTLREMGQTQAEILRAMKKRFGEIVEAQRARWKAEAEAEADACVVRHNLPVYGDTWAA